MLTNDQGIADVDPASPGAQATQSGRLDRVAAHWVKVYPILKEVPPAEIPVLMRAAGNAAVTRVVVGVAAGALCLVCLWVLFGGPSLGIEAPDQRPYPLIALAALLLAAANQLCIRAYLRREVPKLLLGSE